MNFEIKKAVRQGIKPLIGLYGKSGGGKTHSALLLARGIVGEKGNIALIDTENKRGHIFSDIIPSGYNVLDFDAPFSPERYIEAFQAVKKVDIVIVDSMTHEWSGSGGVLDMQEAELDRMAGTDWAKRDRCKMAAWIRPKMAHKKMVGEILRLPMPVICCLRGEEKTHSVKDSKGKTVVVTDDFCTPLFDNRFIFEMLINGEVFQNDKGEGGFLRIGKVTHPKLRSCLPVTNAQINIEHGKLIAEWCADTGIKMAETLTEKKKAESAPERELDPATFGEETKTVKTGVAKITKHKNGADYVFRILGSKDIIYTAFKEDWATVAKTAQDAGLEILIKHYDDSFNSIISVDLIEPE